MEPPTISTAESGQAIRLKAAIVTEDYVTEILEKGADRLSQIVLLSILSVESLSISTQVTLSNISQFSGLTHLKFFWNPTPDQEEEILQLPLLLTLDIKLRGPMRGGQKHGTLPKWILPKLKFLALHGDYIRRYGDTIKDVEKFLNVVGGTLQGIRWDLKALDVEREFPTTFWTALPHLETLEVSLHQLFKIWPPPQSHCHLNLVIGEARVLQSLSYRRVRWSFERPARTIRSSPADDTIGLAFIVPLSWEDFHKGLALTASRSNNYFWQRVFSHLFKELGEKKVRILDLHGSPETSEKGGNVLTYLEHFISLRNHKAGTYDDYDEDDDYGDYEDSDYRREPDAARYSDEEELSPVEEDRDHWDDFFDDMKKDSETGFRSRADLEMELDDMTDEDEMAITEEARKWRAKGGEESY